MATFIESEEVRIWQFDKAPQALRQLAAGASEWLVLIPASLVSSQIERLFLRWDGDGHRVIRKTLPNGSVVLAGSYPSAATMTSGAHTFPAMGRPPVVSRSKDRRRI